MNPWVILGVVTLVCATFFYILSVGKDIERIKHIQQELNNMKGMIDDSNEINNTVDNMSVDELDECL